MEDVGDLACKLCNSPQEDSPMLICNYCGDAYHMDCIQLTEVPKGLWYCDPCLVKLNELADKEALYDKKLFDFLSRNYIPL